MRSLFRVVAALAMAAGVLLAGSVSPARAEEPASISAVGWWSQRPGAAELPEGSFELAHGPNGPLSKAALLIEVRAPVLNAALLVLRESSQFLAELAAVQACPTDDAWTPSNPGAWADAPAHDCEAGAVELGRNTDGVWSADVGPLLRPGSVSVVLVPLGAEGAPVAYQVVLEGARLVASAPAASDQDASEPAPAPEPTAPEEAPTAAPSVPRPAPVVAEPPTRDPGTQIEPAPSEPEVRPTTLAGQDFAGDDKPWWRLLFFVPLAAAVGAATTALRVGLRRLGLVEG